MTVCFICWGLDMPKERKYRLSSLLDMNSD
jgi:hypothetical protein